jgi:hypothetical protein
MAGAVPQAKAKLFGNMGTKHGDLDREQHELLLLVHQTNATWLGY